ncbi:hypothetical protein DQ384_30790 [Sphaerisporangium album]|uniref:Uncharacterized protein n=1 Tax=Sphaerisporangium album TaxID=509200 RepID=A0A367F8L5_9ACTN|nr:hypothetical protein [Sphaerisporangium album]RCG25900.1 hypothetical protein DQ384_30790 [Sphaerisporangium album]
MSAAEDGDTLNGTATFDSRSSQITGSSAVLWQAVEQDNDVTAPTPAPMPMVPVDDPFSGVGAYTGAAGSSAS